MKTIFNVLCSMAILIIIFSSCAASKSQTKKLEAWKDPAYKGGAIINVMIIGDTENLAHRKLFEDTFLKYFGGTGVNTFSSLELLGAGVKIEVDAVKKSAKKNGIDTILVTHLLGSREEKKVTSASDQTLYPAYNSLSDAQKEIAKANHPDVVSTYRYVSLVTHLYDRETEKRFWSYKSETLVVNFADQAIESVCKKVMAELRDDKLIGK
jgi:hypothetical protein